MSSEQLRAYTGGAVGRVQWSKSGITIYAHDGSFITRLENSQDCAFMNITIQHALREIAREQKRRREFKSQQEIGDATQESGTTQMDVGEQAGDGGGVGTRDAEGQASSATGEASAEEEIAVAGI